MRNLHTAKFKKRYVTVNELVDTGLFSRSTLNRIISRDDFPAVNPTGRSWRIDIVTLECMLQEGKQWSTNEDNGIRELQAV